MKSNLKTNRLVLTVVALAIAATALLLIAGFAILDHARWSVISSEQQIADHIFELGGYYQTKHQQIRYVNFNDTKANDEDIALVLKLPQLNWLEIKNTSVTDASLPAIFAHPNLRILSVEGSEITEPALYKAVVASEARIFTDIIFSPHEYN